MTQLWTEKYRPQNINDYVWRDESQKAMAEKWIKEGVLPSILLAGTAGIGKTSAARMLLNELQVDSGDILEINASKERKVDDIQDKVLNFVSTFPLGDFKYVILDECLHEDEKIQLANGSSISLKEMKDFTEYDVKSVNMKSGKVEINKAVVISRKSDIVFKITLLDGRTIKATGNHPFLVYNNDGAIIEKLLRNLTLSDKVVATNNEGITTSVEIQEIKRLGGIHNTVNLFVENNHTFITENGIATHNCDSISPLAQKMLRAEIENYSDTCRFILTANYKNKIIPALQSRCVTINMESLDKDQFMDRIVNIAISEGITIETEEDIVLLNKFMDLSYPDMRKCINLMQQNTFGGKLNDPREDETGDKDYLADMVGMFASGQYTTARKLLVAQARPEEYEEIFRWFYQHLEIWGEEDKQNEALLIIRNALVNHALVADPEINMSAMIVELCSLL